LRFNLLGQRNDLYQVPPETNASASRAASRFNDPNVALAIDAILGELLLYLLSELEYFLELRALLAYFTVSQLLFI
jgi:hypothetical protein